MLTKRKQKLPLTILAAAIATGVLAVLVPFVTGAAAQSEPRVGVSDAAVAELALLQRPVDRFQSIVHAVAAEIRAVERREEREAREAAARKREERFAQLPGGVTMATLESIASCESGGDLTVVSSDGTYRGKYQFDVSTWRTVGGHGDPAAAPEDEQDYRAALLYTRSGSNPWPVCG